MFVTKYQEIASNVESVLEKLQRSEISNPPAFGAKIACEILTNPRLREVWYADLRTMSSRIAKMRATLCTLLTEYGMETTVVHLCCR